MFILVAYKQFPAPKSGHAGGQSVWRLLERWHQRGHQLALVARITDEERREQKEALSTLEALCEGRLRLVPHHRSLPGPRALALFHSYAMLRRATIVALQTFHPDLLHVEFAQTGVATWGIPALSFRAHDVNWFLADQQKRTRQGWKRHKAAQLYRLFRWLEPRLYRRYPLLTAISEGDRRLIAEATGRDDLLTLPLEPAFPPEARVGPLAVPRGANLLFVGAMHRSFNVEAVLWFARAVWPRVQERFPEAHFYIVGAHPTPAVEALGAEPGITVTGFVEDLAPWYRAADLFVSPLLVAGGLLQKVLDAMAMGVPIVATPQSNHGVGAPPHAITLAKNPVAFAEAIIALLRDRERAHHQAETAAQFVRAHYNLDRALARWERAAERKLARGWTEGSLIV